MARITIEKCLELGYNKFMVVHLVAKRIVELRRGKELLIPTSNEEIVAALREIEAGKVAKRETASLLPEGLTGEGFPADSLLPSDPAAAEGDQASAGTQDTDDNSGTPEEDSG